MVKGAAAAEERPEAYSAPSYLRPRRLPRGAPRWLDGAVAAALAGITFLLLMPYLNPAFLSVRRSVLHQPDEGTILSNADRVARGHSLYREVFDFKGPVGYAPFVAAFKLGDPTARNGRLAMFVVISLWAAAMYGAARLISGRRSLGLLMALLVPLQVWPAWSYAYQDFTAQFFLTLALLLALAAPGLSSRPAAAWPGIRSGSGSGSGSGSRWLLAASGASASLAFWTSVAQGLSGMVALWGTVIFLAALAGGPRAALREGVRFGTGVLVGSVPVLIWLGSMGSIGAGLYATIPFPLQYYMSAANVAPYAYDELIYSNQWRGAGPEWVRLAVKSMMRVTVLIPRIALAVAVGVALGLLVLAALTLLRRRTGRVAMRASLPQWGPLARIALPASLAATSVSVVIERTRSDICHIGFIEGGCLLAICALFGLKPTNRPGRRIATILQAGVAAALVYTVAVAAAFHGYAWRQLPPKGPDLDSIGRADSGADAIVAATKPWDHIFVTPYGGWAYLYSRRDNATSFAFLIEDTYCTLHWPIAARQIVDNRPALLLIPEGAYNIVVAHQPKIASMYVGLPGRYSLR